MDVDDYLFETGWQKVAEDIAAYMLRNGMDEIDMPRKTKAKRAL